MTTFNMKPLALALSSILTPLAIHAQEAIQMEPILVSASRPMMFDSRLASTSVLTSEEIKAINPQSLPDALRHVEGAYVTTSGLS